jgi:hypothetical protein
MVLQQAYGSCRRPRQSVKASKEAKRTKIMNNIETNYVRICETVHPVTHEPGTLFRSRESGLYTFGTKSDPDQPAYFISINYHAAQEIAAKARKPGDRLQDALIKRMQALNLTPVGVTALIPGISQAHVIDYLTRRKSMGSHKIQWIMEVLGLEVRPITATITDKGLALVRGRKTKENSR